MEPISLQIFEPDNKFRLTPNLILLTLWTLSLGFCWVDGSVQPVMGLLILVVFVVSIFFLIGSFFMYKPLKGKLNGNITFESDHMVINNDVFELNAINDLDFSFY